MAVGILGFGVHIPRYRLARSVVARAWGAAYGPGERAVANFDEDAVTMAVSAAESAVNGGEAPDAVYFASTSAPYQDKQSSTLVGAVIGTPRNAIANDFTGSPRAGTAALRAAHDAVKAGSSKRVLVVASEVRTGEPGGDQEQVFGDAAAAFILGEGDVLATLDGVYSISEEFTDTWRNQHDVMGQRGDAAFVTTFGYQRITRDALKGALDHFGLKAEDIAKVALAAPDRRSYGTVLGAVGLAGVAPEDPLLATVGDAGSAQAMLLLAQALESATAGDKILVVSYGSGNCDVVLLTATGAVAKAVERGQFARELATKRPLENYERFLAFRNVVEQEELSPYSSLSMLWKEQKQDLRLIGVRCQACGAVSFPRQRICRQCRAKDQMEDKALGRTGTVYTYTNDHLFPSPDSPTSMVVADLEGGFRFYGQLTDAIAKNTKIGMKVEMTFRRIHEGGGYHNYFWKMRPPAEG